MTSRIWPRNVEFPILSPHTTRTVALCVAANVYAGCERQECTGEAGAYMFGHNERAMLDLSSLERYVFTASYIDEQF